MNWLERLVKWMARRDIVRAIRLVEWAIKGAEIYDPEATVCLLRAVDKLKMAKLLLESRGKQTFRDN